MARSEDTIQCSCVNCGYFLYSTLSGRCAASRTTHEGDLTSDGKEKGGVNVNIVATR